MASLLLWPLIIATASCHKVVESTEDIAPDQNTTTLYPVPNTTQGSAVTKHDVTTWKIESTFGKPPKDSNSTDSKEQLVVEDFGKASTTSSYGNESKEFKPSPHIGFFDDVEPTSDTFDSFTPVIKKQPSGFVGFPDHQSKTKDIFKNYQKFPYNIESGIFTKAKPWAHTMETRPTAAVPVKVPAGGLYQLPDPFKEKPGDEEFGLEFSDVKENSVKRRPTPWKKIMHLITALIPVGILFSALTPNVITLHSVGAGMGPDQLSSNVFRRADASVSAPAQLPAISERCRRRLLCELHSDRNYALYARSSGASPRRVRQCHRIPCEDPEAVARTLRWFLTYHHSDPGGHT